MDYDKKEYEAILELKTMMKEHVKPSVLEDDHLFYRFLKARDFNIQQAESMLKQHLEWRKTLDVDNILKYKIPEVLDKYMPYESIGFDKDGCSVVYLPSGNIDWIGIALSVKQEELKKKVVYEIEMEQRLMKEQTRKLGKRIDKSSYIHNLENFSFTAATDKKVVSNAITLFQMYINNYPESLKAVYVINASMHFSIIFSVLKKCLPASILSKIKVYWDDSYKKDFLDIMDADVLPAFLGGNKTDPNGNPLCKTFINHGGPIPDKYFKHRSKRALSSQPDVRRVMLARAAFHEVSCEVPTAGSFLEWEFETKSRDIGFGLFYQQTENGQNKNIELVPLQRINTDEYAETSIYLCEKPGIYVVVFDNTYSWLRSKEIFYRIKVTTTAERESVI